mmetsp:Transcript_16624/g.35293  ORF Transcript_16624/g.35293 Transcript_16624/m.35293 type:complete len:374 (-) Transcript_16624:73-1194(-)
MDGCPPRMGLDAPPAHAAASVHLTARPTPTSDAVLVLPRLGDVAHPLDCLVVALLEDLEEADVEARGCKHGHLEVHCDWRSAPRLVAHGGHHLHLARHEVLGVAGEAAQLPDDALLLGLVPALARGGADVGNGRVLRQRDLHDDVRGEQLECEHRFDLDVDLEPRAAKLLHNGQHSERQVDVLGDAVGHELELAVRRDERDGAVHVELAQLDALVEGDVVDLDARARTSHVGLLHLGLVVEQQLVVEAELALGRAAEVALDHDGARDVVAQDGAFGAHEEVAVLHDVDKELVFPVLDAVLPPADGAGGLDGDARVLGALGRRLAVALLRDVHLEHVGGAVLGVAVVEHLVEQLVDEDEVVADRVLVEIAEVGF